MLNPAHILETAFLLLSAFLIGAVTGSLAKLAVLRLRPARPAVAATGAARADAVVDQPALVAAPVIDPVAKPAQPQAPDEVPTPDFSEVAKAIAEIKAEVATLSEIRMPKVAPLPSMDAVGKAPVMAPARQAGKATSGKQVPSPKVADDATPAPVVPSGPSADVIPFPAERAAPPASIEEAAKVVDVEMVDEPPTEAAVADEAPKQEPTKALEPANTTPVAVEPAPAPEDITREQQSEMEAAKVAEAAKPDDKGAATEDETAAMRAIEGTWTPRRNAARRAAKVPAPEGVAVDEPPAVEAADTPEPPGKPAGLAAPRGGVKDNLTNIIGILPVIETSLNSIGVYHFDQIGQFSDENVAWLESHLGIGGRIDREHWREQARELAVISDRARKVAGQP